MYSVQVSCRLRATLLLLVSFITGKSREMLIDSYIDISWIAWCYVTRKTLRDKVVPKNIPQDMKHGKMERRMSSLSIECPSSSIEHQTDSNEHLAPNAEPRRSNLEKGLTIVYSGKWKLCNSLSHVEPQQHDYIIMINVMIIHFVNGLMELARFLFFVFSASRQSWRAGGKSAGR